MTAGATIGIQALSAGRPCRALSDVILPQARRAIGVTSQARLGAALAEAVPGDHIVLADGSYTGPGAFAKSGTRAAPIVIRSENLLGAQMTGPIDLDGSDIILHGLDFVDTRVVVGQSVQSDRVRIWRCRWRDQPKPSTAIALRTQLCHDLDLAYCEWTNWAGRGVSFGVAAGTRRPRVRRCLFRNTPAGFSQNATEAIQIGFGHADRPIACAALIELCRFAGWNSDDETVSVKSSGNTLRQLTFENNRGRCGNRMGQFNRFEAIWFDGPNGMRIHDKGNIVIGCDLGQAGQGLRIAMGNHDADSLMTRNATPNAVDTEVAGCRGTITIAHAFPGHDIQAQRTVVRQHAGSVLLVAGTQLGTDSQPDRSDMLHSWLPAMWLGDADVGPGADVG
jgi:hypothetical protein